MTTALCNRRGVPEIAMHETAIAMHVPAIVMHVTAIAMHVPAIAMQREASVFAADVV